MKLRLLVAIVAIVALVALAATTGCVARVRGNMTSPGIADVREGGVTPRGAPLEPRDPGANAVVLQATAFGGGGWNVASNTTTGYGTVGLEVTAFGLTLDSSRDQGAAFRAARGGRILPYVGWALVRAEDNDRVRVGPGYVDVRYAFVGQDLFRFSVGAGAAFDVGRDAIGPEERACVEVPFGLVGVCVAASELIGHGTDLQLQVVMSSFLEYVWTR